MSFTTKPIIRDHLLHSQAPALLVENEEVLLNGTDDSQLSHANLEEDSAIVKLLPPDRIIAEGGATVLHDKEIALSEVNLIKDSSVVALTPDFSVVYQEEIDYRIDHEHGSFTALSTGSIVNNTTVYIYYQTYDVYEEGTDFMVQYTSGKLARRSGSAIPDGATVLVDYTVAAGSEVDALIDQAIVEAEDMILRSLAEGYDETSDDQGLTTGATQLALSIIARGLAADSLMINRSADASNRTREWRELSAVWEAAAWETLGPFLNPNALNSPVVQ